MELKDLLPIDRIGWIKCSSPSGLMMDSEFKGLPPTGGRPVKLQPAPPETNTTPPPNSRP
eukprot:1261555-Rhodomonas_salina.1